MGIFDVIAEESQEQIVERLLPIAKQVAYEMLDRGTLLMSDFESPVRFKRYEEIADLLKAQDLNEEDICRARYIVVQILLGNDAETYTFPQVDPYSHLYFRDL